MEDVRIAEDLPVEMRDGTALAADRYLPPDGDPRAESGEGEDGAPGAFPTLIARTPYDRREQTETAAALAERGYAVVVQDVRGTFGSEGSFYPYRSGGSAEAEDGYDTVEWAAARPWSNGRVGTFGASYLGATQWALAHNDRLPPHLEAMAPGFAVSSYYGQGAYAGGAALLSHNVDYLTEFAVERFDREHPERAGESTPLDRAREALPQLYWDLPVDPYEPLERVGYSWLADWHGHETYGTFWRRQDHTRHYDSVDVPVLNYGGWYDIFGQGTLENFRGLRREAATEDAREAATLVVGPHTHGETASRAQGQLVGHAHEFPENATYEQVDLLAAWFDRHLKAEPGDGSQDRRRAEDGSAGGERESDPDPDRVRIYVPGLDEWVGAPAFPLPETEFRAYYLRSDGDARVDAVSAESPGYAGRLTTAPPGDEPPDRYSYDPADPVPSVGGYNTHWDGGVADRATAYGGRDDVLVYQTGILDEPVAVVGPITVTLYAATAAVDTDFVTVLSDVDPSARAGGTWIAEGARRGRIGDVEADPRDPETYAAVDLLEPGAVSAWRIAVWPTARVFAAGHRIRVDVASSNFPRYSRNLNTGAGLGGAESTVAEQTVYHDRERPSRVEVPVVPLDALEARIVDGPVPGPATGGK
jgi:putative CocE/NonD family hydrolase